MKRMYFTFGTDSAYPYGIKDYIVALGTDTADCIAAFKKKHPNRPGSNCINCADYYSGSEWERVKKEHYKDVEPKEILISDTAYGCKPEWFGPFWFAVPSRQQIVFLQEGSGDNLDNQDRKNGYVDYLDFTVFELWDGEVDEGDGGMLLLKEYIQDKYACLADAIPDVLDDLYGDPYLAVQIIKERESD